MAKLFLWLVAILGLIVVLNNYNHNIHTELYTKVVILCTIAVIAVVEAIEHRK